MYTYISICIYIYMHVYPYVYTYICTSVKGLKHSHLRNVTSLWTVLFGKKIKYNQVSLLKKVYYFGNLLYVY